MLVISLVALASATMQDGGEVNGESGPIVLQPLEPITSPAPADGKASVPVPRGNPGRWVTPNDYPRAALEAEHQGTTGFRLKIDPTGGISDCQVIKSSGHKVLDDATCKNILKRGRFRSAKDEDGNNIAGEYSNRVRWQIPGANYTAVYLTGLGYPRPPRPAYFGMLTITDEDYPKLAVEERREGSNKIVLQVNADGQVTDCKIASSSTHDDLDAQSCTLAINTWQFRPALDIDGKPTAGRAELATNWRLPPRDSDGAEAEKSFTSKPRMNPFEYPGSATLILDINNEGKLSDCKLEKDSDKGIFSEIDKFSETLCTPDMMELYGPFARFKDQNGNPAARRVILKLSLEHGEFQSVDKETETSDPSK